MFATVSEKGQVTLPKRLRDQMGIRPGARLDFRLGKDGTLEVRLLKRGAGSLFGLLARAGEHARTLEEMDDGVSEAVQARSRAGR
jgi:antitoxin PrlF